MATQRTPTKLGARTVHLCVDMQKMFSEETAWQTPWMKRVLPVVERLARHRPENTIFTRFIPPARPEDADGAWQDYFRRWHQFTTEEADPDLLELLPSLAELAPPATVLDKPTYSPFHRSPLHSMLRERAADTLIITGAETDVCVLAAVMSALDHGYKIVIPKDALCSSSDETHDALLTVYANRFGVQIELTDAETIIASWN